MRNWGGRSARAGLADSDGATEWLRVLGGGAGRGLAFKFPQGPGSMPRHMAATGAALGGGPCFCSSFPQSRR